MRALSSNPLLGRVIDHHSRRNILIAGILALGIGFIIAVITIWFCDRVGAVTGFAHGGSELAVLILSLVGVHMVVPVIVTVIAILQTTELTHRPDFDLLRVTPLTDDNFWLGFMVATFYQCRYVLAVLAGMAPGLLSWAYQVGLGAMLVVLALILDAWSFVVLAVVEGVIAGMENGPTWYKLLYTPFQIFILGFVFLIGLILLLFVPILAIFWMFAPLLLTFLVAKSVRRQMRAGYSSLS